MVNVYCELFIIDSTPFLLFFLLSMIIDERWLLVNSILLSIAITLHE